MLKSLEITESKPDLVLFMDPSIPVQQVFGKYEDSLAWIEFTNYVVVYAASLCSDLRQLSLFCYLLGGRKRSGSKPLICVTQCSKDFDVCISLEDKGLKNTILLEEDEVESFLDNEIIRELIDAKTR